MSTPLPRWVNKNNMIDLSVDLCGKKLQNPLILASGILGTEAGILSRIAKLKIGAVTPKSCSIEPRTGYENPTVLAWKHGLINAVGLSNPGIKVELEELKKLKKSLKISGTKLIASIFGPTIQDIAQTAKMICEADPDFVEVNISCPHVDPTVKGCFYSDPDATLRLTKEVKKNCSVPVIIKLSPNVTDIASIALAAEKGGADAIAAINALGPGMIIDLEAGKPVLANKFGGISGPAIKPIAIRSIWDITQKVKIPVIGIGGVTTGEDAIEMIMAGATAVGVGSAVYYGGIEVFEKITREMKAWMEKHNIKSLDEIRGVSHAD